LHQKRVEDTSNQRYFSPRSNDQPARMLVRNDSSTSRLKKISTGKSLAFKKKSQVGGQYDDSGYMIMANLQPTRH
jgi:hypothetical protein